MRILLVDDDEVTLKMLGGLLAARGHVIDRCRSAEPALERVREAHYDVLLTDVVTNAMSGAELVTKARELRPTLRCMIMSEQKRTEDLPADVGWFRKPVDVQRLLATLASDGPHVAPATSDDDRFGELFESAPDGIFVTTSDGRYTNVNAAGCRLLGYSHDELLGRSIAEFIAPDQLARQTALKTHILGGGREVSEWDVRRKDGTFVPVELSTNSLPDGRMRAFVRDISERRAAEERLRLSELKFSGIVSISADAIISVDEGGDITMFNEGAEAMFGYGRNEVLGSSLDNLIPERFRSAHTAHVKRFAEGPDQARRMGARSASIRGVRKNGDEFPADATISRLVVGGQQLLVVALRDITEQKRLEDEQRLLADIGTILVEAGTDAARLLTDVATAVVRDMADWCAVDVVHGREVERLRIVHNDPAQNAVCDALVRHRLERPGSRALTEALASQRPMLVADVTPAYLASVADGPEHLALVQALGTRSAMIVPLIARGQTLGSLSFGSARRGRHYDERDVAQAERLASRLALAVDNALLHEALERAIRARDDVLGIVAHDLRNPLNAIVLNAQSMGRRGQPERRDQGAVLAIRNAAKRMNTLIQDLLEVARLEGGQKLSIARGAVPTEALLAEAVERQGAALSEYSRTLVVDAAAAPATVDADRARLLQILDNLLGNAIKFSREHIALSVSVANGETVFSVADDGHGVPSEILPRLFDRFWQANRADGRGAGLGLWIVKQIAEAHGGRLWVESELDQGTTFYFTLSSAAPP
jgi:PAS domain S-box-containing protein